MSLPANPGRPRRFKLVLITALLGLHLLLGFFPGIMQKFGVGKSVVWFRDTHSMLAASDSARAGLDPYVENPYDVAGERHIYTDWWYALGRVGLTREDAFWLGATLVAGFWLTVLAVVPLNSWRDVGWTLALCASPPVWLAVNRANPDLLMFILLTLAAWLLARPQRGLRLASPLPVALAIGLKFYPVLGGVLFFPATGSRRESRLRWVLIAALGLVLAWSLADDVQRYLAAGWLARGLFTFGAAAIPVNYGFDPDTSVACGRLLGAGLLAWALSRAPDQAALPDTMPAGARRFYLLGVAVLAGSFFLTTGYLYKIIFAVWLLPACLNLGTRPGNEGRLELACLVGLVWVEGLACAVLSFAPEMVGDGGAILVRRAAATISGLLAWGLVIPSCRRFGAELRVGWARAFAGGKESPAN